MEGIARCAACDLALVAQEPEPEYSMATGPLTGRPIEDEVATAGPAVAGTFVTMEEAQSAVRTLGDAGIPSEVDSRGEPFPMTISKYEPPLDVVVAPADLPRARKALRDAGLMPIVVARFRREEEARTALVLLESKGLKPRISTLVLDEIPAEFREEMEPYIVEVPAEEEAAARELLEGIFLRCDVCGAQIQRGEPACRACGETIEA